MHIVFVLIFFPDYFIKTQQHTYSISYNVCILNSTRTALTNSCRSIVIIIFFWGGGQFHSPFFFLFSVVFVVVVRLLLYL